MEFQDEDLRMLYDTMDMGSGSKEELYQVFEISAMSRNVPREEMKTLMDSIEIEDGKVSFKGFCKVVRRCEEANVRARNERVMRTENLEESGRVENNKDETTKDENSTKGNNEKGN